MTMTTRKTLLTRRMPTLYSVLLMVGTVACGGGASVPAETAATPAAGPMTIDIVRVVEQPLDVQLSLPGELTPYQSVSIYPRVTAFVKTVHVDRGSLVRAGDVIAVLEAPELVAQRSEAQSKLQAAEAQLAGVQAKADSDRGTYDKLKAASATPGVVAGNDVLVAEKTAEASQNQVNAARAEHRGGAAGGKRDQGHGGLPSSHGAIQRRGDRTQCTSRCTGRAVRRFRGRDAHGARGREQPAAAGGPGAGGLHR